MLNRGDRRQCFRDLCEPCTDTACCSSNCLGLNHDPPLVGKITVHHFAKIKITGVHAARCPDSAEPTSIISSLTSPPVSTVKGHGEWVQSRFFGDIKSAPLIGAVDTQARAFQGSKSNKITSMPQVPTRTADNGSAGGSYGNVVKICTQANYRGMLLAQAIVSSYAWPVTPARLVEAGLFIYVSNMYIRRTTAHIPAHDNQ